MNPENYEDKEFLWHLDNFRETRSYEEHIEKSQKELMFRINIGVKAI